MPPSTSENRAGRQRRPIPKAPGAGIRDAATLRIADRPRAPRACANTACRFSIGAWRVPRPNPSGFRAASPLRPDLCDRAGRRCVRVVRARAYRALAMTGRAARPRGRGPNLVLFPELGAGLRLIIRRLPLHIEYLIFRAENLLRVAMAIQAPLHQQSIGLEYQRHLVDLPVARRTAHALIDMNAVIEIDEISQAVNFDPLDGFIAAIALADGLQVGCIIEKHRMAVHAGLRGRDAGNGGNFHAGMTVAAVNAVVADVMLVAELHRLLAGNVLPRHVGRARHRKDSDKRHSDQKKRRKHTESRDEIRAAMKNLGHVCSALCGGALRKGAAVRASLELTRKCNPGSCLTR